MNQRASVHNHVMLNEVKHPAASQNEILRAVQGDSVRLAARRLAANWPLALILLVAFALRLCGSRANLPHLYSPGESIVVRQALAYGAGTLRPYSFIYPPLYSYVLFALYGLYFAIGKLIGLFPTVAEFAISYFTDATPFYLIGRVLTGLLGGATVWLTYSIAAKAYGRKVGWLAAGFLAVSHLHVVHSHNVLTDIPMACAVMAAIWLILRATERNSWRDWALAGFAVGVAAATKYPAAVAAVSYATAVLISLRGESLAKAWRRFALLALLGALAALMGFFLACPYAIFDFRALWSDLFGIQAGMNQGIAKPFQETMAFYFSTLLRSGLTRLLGSVSLLGLLYMLWRRRWQDILLLSFPPVYLLFLGVQGRYQPNWLLPALPFFCIAAALLIDEAARKWRGEGRTGDIFITVVALLVSFYPAWYSYFYLKSISVPDTRTLAKGWIERNIPAGAKILLDSSSTGPPLQQTLPSLERYFANAEGYKDIGSRPEQTQAAFSSYRAYQMEAAKRLAQREIAYDLDYMQLAWWRAEEDETDWSEYPVFGAYRERLFSLEQLREAGFEYVVASSFKYRQYLTPEGQEKWPSYYAFYRSLEEQAALVEFLQADPIHQPGPDIKIYDLRRAP